MIALLWTESRLPVGKLGLEGVCVGVARRGERSVAGRRKKVS